MAEKPENGDAVRKGITVRIGSQTVLLPDLNEMTVDEMRDELAMWRAMFLGVDELTRDLMFLIGKDVIVFMRNYQAVKARLFGVQLKPEQIVVGGPVQYYDPVEAKMKLAIAMQRIPYANILSVNEVIKEIGPLRATSEQFSENEQVEPDKNKNEFDDQ